MKLRKMLPSCKRAAATAALLIVCGAGIAVVLMREFPAKDVCLFDSPDACDAAPCCTWCGDDSAQTGQGDIQVTTTIIRTLFARTGRATTTTTSTTVTQGPAGMCSNVASGSKNCSKSLATCEHAKNETQCSSSSMCRWHPKSSPKPSVPITFNCSLATAEECHATPCCNWYATRARARSLSQALSLTHSLPVTLPSFLPPRCKSTSMYGDMSWCMPVLNEAFWQRKGGTSEFNPQK